MPHWLEQPGELLTQHRWLRDLLLLLGVWLVAWLPARVTDRLFTRWGLLHRPEAPIDRSSRLISSSLRASLWPVWAAVMLATGFALWMRLAPETAGAPFHVLPILAFLLFYRVLEAVAKEMLAPGPTRRRLRRIALPLVFATAVLQQLGALADFLSWAERPLFRLGTTVISVQGIVLGGLITAAFVIGARLTSAFLGGRLLPGLGLDRSVSEALATILRYALIALGVLVALDTVGFDLTALKIGLGALGVGIGFGLQNLVTNFVSGLILLFERTIKRGDIIQLGGTDGRVLQIGLRSSVVRTRAGLEIIVPNSDLVTSQVTNFSYHDRKMRVDVPVGVSYGADPPRVRELLLEAAAAEPQVLKEPAPDVLFHAFGESSLDFVLRAWIAEAWEAPRVRSALYFRIWETLKRAGIEIPFPQRDLHVRDGDLRVRVAAQGSTDPGAAPSKGGH